MFADRVLGTVDKHVLLDGVTMKVDEHVYLLKPALLFLHELFEVVDLREGELALLVIRPVEVLSEETCAIVASHHTVGIHHRDDFEDELTTQLLRSLLFTAEVLYQSFSNVRTIGFAGMNSCAYYHQCLQRRIQSFVGYCQHWDAQTAEALAQSLRTVVGIRTVLGPAFLQHPNQPCVGIGHAVRKQRGIILRTEVVREGINEVLSHSVLYYKRCTAR